MLKSPNRKAALRCDRKPKAEMVRAMSQSQSRSVTRPVGGPGPSPCVEGSPTPEQRNAPRFTLLIRAAKLITGDGEFLVVVRDISRDGLKVRTFHPLPPDLDYAIELSGG